VIAVNATTKFHKLVGFSDTPLLRNTDTIPATRKIQPKLLVCLGNTTRQIIPIIKARTEPTAGRFPQKKGEK